MISSDDGSFRPSEPDAGLLKRIGALRDSVIAFGTGLYLLGYFSWAFYAWTQHLGLIPALDAQYFAAGVFPAAVLLSLYGVARLLRWLARWSRSKEFSEKKESDRKGKTGKVLEIAGAVLFLVGFIATQLTQRYALVRFSLIIAGTLSIYASAFFSRRRSDKFLRMLAQGALWTLLSIGGAWLLLGYFVAWFSKLPQELGGPSARCVELDLNTTKLSQETLRLVLPDGYTVESRETHRSRSMYLIFEGSDFILVKPESGDTGLLNPARKIGKDAIQAVFPCS